MTEAYTVSKMLSSINETMAPVATDVCASVSLKRRMDNGVMLDTSEKEIAYLDLKSKVKHVAQSVASLDRPKRLVWITEQRAKAKSAFDCGEYQQAGECYIQTLTALDFGSTPEEKHETQQQVQIPLTCNLAACMLMLEEWEKAKRICDQVLAIDPVCVRALQQRAKALTRLTAFDDARRDLKLIKSTVSGGNRGDEIAVSAQLEKQFIAIARAELRYKHAVRQQRTFQRTMMAQAVGKLYSEKEAPAARVDPPVPTWSGWVTYLVTKATQTVYSIVWSIIHLARSTKHLKSEC